MEYVDRGKKTINKAAVVSMSLKAAFDFVRVQRKVAA